MEVRVRRFLLDRDEETMDLLEAMNTEYRLSKLWLVASFVLTVPFYLCLLLAALMSGPPVKWVTFAAFTLQLLMNFSRIRSGVHYSLGESVRRPAMLQTGLGINISQVSVAKMTAKYGIAFKGEAIRSEKYYESSSVLGLRKLTEITLESAFWTAELAGRMAGLLKSMLLVVGVILGVSVLAILQAGLMGTQSQVLAKIYMITITVWCAGDLWVLWRKYDSLANGVQKVLADCEGILSRSEIGYDALFAFGDYNCCLAAAAVIPDFIYRRNRKRLNEAWGSRNNLNAASPKTG
jgi:hypothetical protein